MQFTPKAMAIAIIGEDKETAENLLSHFGFTPAETNEILYACLGCRTRRVTGPVYAVQRIIEDTIRTTEENHV